MKLTGKSQEVGERLLESFRNGDIPKAASQVFVRAPHLPCDKWSWSNRFITAIHGTSDARGFRQWQDVGRSVQKGAKAFCILGPSVITKDDGDGQKHTALVGFHAIPVFRREDTEIVDAEKWGRVEALDAENKSFVDGLPFLRVAKAWGLSVGTYSGANAGYLGYYTSRGTIALGTKNLSTWAHELCHAADDRITGLEGNKLRRETVAELGGAILLSLVGQTEEADTGGCYEYIVANAGDKAKAINIAMKYLDAACKCVDLIIKTALETE